MNSFGSLRSTFVKLAIIAVVGNIIVWSIVAGLVVFVVISVSN